MQRESQHSTINTSVVPGKPAQHSQSLISVQASHYRLTTRLITFLQVCNRFDEWHNKTVEVDTDDHKVCGNENVCTHKNHFHSTLYRSLRLTANESYVR